MSQNLNLGHREERLAGRKEAVKASGVEACAEQSSRLIICT